MKWQLPPKIKVHEALGCIADGRIELDGNEAKVYSSSRGKFYTVRYDPDKNAIMANDNGSYWVGYLGYPSIAFLMVRGVIHYGQKFAEALKEIKWKDINTKFKNDFVKTEKYILDIVKKRGMSGDKLNKEIDYIYEQLRKLNIEILGERTIPPQGY